LLAVRSGQEPGSGGKLIIVAINITIGVLNFCRGIFCFVKKRDWNQDKGRGQEK
jgi:hypothetical protein